MPWSPYRSQRSLWQAIAGHPGILSRRHPNVTRSRPAPSPCLSAGDDVDQVRRTNDDLANDLAFKRCGDLATGQCLLLQVFLTDADSHLEAIAHLALDLNDTRHRVVHEQRRVGCRDV